MAERDTLVTTADGDQLNEGYFNSIRNSNRLVEVYESTGFDSAQSGSAGTDTGSYEFSAINASDLVGVNYLEISFFVDYYVRLYGSPSSAELKIETKEVGGSYSTAFNKTIALAGDTKTSYGEMFVYTHTLTAGEKSNGVQVKVSSSSVVAGTGEASVDNIQTLLSTKR